MTTRVCLAGATGWAGSELSQAIAATEDLLVGVHRGLDAVLDLTEAGAGSPL